MTDSTTLAGWLRKTNFREHTGDDPDPVQARVRIKLAHHHAVLLLGAGIKEYSQWFPGRENNVADALLHDFDCSDAALTQILHGTCPSQLPQYFHIAPLPNKISSWLTLLLQKLPMREQLWEAHTRTKLGHGDTSPDTSSPSESATTSSSTPSQDPNEKRSSVPLPWLSEKGNFLGPSHNTLAVGTIRNSISDVCATFRGNGQPNPTKDNDLQLSFLLHR
jgi:hypothetical protein